MKTSMRPGTLALAATSVLAIAGCADPYYYPPSAYGTPIGDVPSAPVREVVVERAPVREVIVERAPAREVVVERPATERIYVAPAGSAVGGQIVARDGTPVYYDREIVLGPNTRDSEPR